jgi:ubiquinone/menaquinone biosynthesis C-methylase UbiE
MTKIDPAHLFTEAKIQLLIALVELEQPVETPNNTHHTFYPTTIEEAAAYFYGFREDWTEAAGNLQKSGLIRADGAGWKLTPKGLKQSTRLRQARPPIYYWYRKFYSVLHTSQAYSRFCHRLYGADLSQAGFSDLKQLEAMLKDLDLSPDDRVMDLGCGAGRMAEWVSDQSGASVLGVDYSPFAIQWALERTVQKRNRLDFKVGNMDDLDLSPGSFNAIISIDSLYMPTDLPATLINLMNLLKPGGRLAVFFMEMVWDAEGDRSMLKAENLAIAREFTRMGLVYRATDYSRQTYEMMQRKRVLADEMRQQFEDEGNPMLYQFCRDEAIASFAPYDPARPDLSRYLYLVTKA